VSRIAPWLALALAGVAMLVPSVTAQQGGGLAYSLDLKGTIDPATERWVDSALDEAGEDGARLAIIRLDTPGGLDSSTREIVRDIVGAPMPVVVYVSPDGARAGSAGAYITQAADVAAMAPQTNIGSATPISIGPEEQDEVLGRKIRNDASAYMRALAESHGRNPRLGERMVRSATNVTATEARRASFIDVVADNEPELLGKLDGFRVKGPKAQVLETSGLRVERHSIPLHLEILQLLVNPTIAFLLLTAGLIGIAIEIFNPGLILPGTLGLIAFLLGLYGTAQLPVTAVGILLLMLAVGLMVAEGQLSAGGALGGGGVVALILSGLLLFDTDSGALSVSVPIVILAGLLLGAFLALAIERTMRARREPVHTGYEELVGRVGEVRATLAPDGQIFIEGALWRARLEDESGRALPGDRVRVQSVEGLTLMVQPAAEAETASH